MFQDDFKRNKSGGGFISDLLAGVAKDVSNDFEKKSGGGFISDLSAGVTKDAVKSAASAAGKATMEGALEGAKKTLSEGEKKAGKKIVWKTLGEGMIPEEGIVEDFGGDEDLWETIAPHAKKVIEKCNKKGGKKKKLTKIEKELLDFFEK